MTRALVREIIKAATRQHATKVVSAKVKLDALAGISPDRLREQFVIAAMGSIAEEAVLEVEIASGSFESHTNGIYLETVELIVASQ